MLHDQTYLVDSILKEESEMKNACQWYNHLAFNVTLTEETFTGNLAELENRVTEMRNQLAGMQKQLDEDDTLADTVLYRMMLNRLVNDVELLLKAEGKGQQVFQWLLVPYWLSDKLIAEGEVILRVYGNNWWGITNLISYTEVLMSVKKELEDHY
ncbi:hypothetical protein FLA_2195 [Filimonas lacunae]|nr:hypothetical protein FLA_2195 [Filimonas lacunae]